MEELNKRLEFERIRKEEIEKKRIEEEKRRKIDEEIMKQKEFEKKEELKSEEEMKNQKIDLINNNNIYKEKKEFICKIDGIKFFNDESFLEHYKDEHPDTYLFYYNYFYQNFNSQEPLLGKKKLRTKNELKDSVKDKDQFQRYIWGKLFNSNVAVDMNYKGFIHNSIFKDD